MTLAAILGTLGYGLAEEELARTTVPPSPASRPSPTPETKNDAAVSQARDPFPSEISVIKPPGSERPNWMATVDPLATASDPSAVFRVPMATLLLPRRERAVLIHAAGQRRAIGEIDLDRTIDAIAANSPLEVLPRQLVFTLREGVQLLCDSSPGMEPFALDAAQIADAVRAVAGRDRVLFAYFLGCPLRGLVRWRDNGSERYRPPSSGQPVLALSDLGAFRPTGGGRAPVLPTEWIDFDLLLRRRGSPLTVLFPGALRRVPPSLRGRLRILPLDRATGVRTGRGIAKVGGG
jgi:hypothetical protein